MWKKPVCLSLILILLFSLIPSGAFAADGEPPCANGHTWDEGVVTDNPEAAPCDTKTYTCTLCGETKSVLLLPAVTGFEFDTASTFGADDVVVGIGDIPCPGLDAYEFYFSIDGGRTWTDCVYRHEADSLDSIYLTDFVDLPSGTYDKIMVKSVSDSEGYEPGVFTADCWLTVDVEDMPAPSVQLVPTGGTNRFGGPSYYLTISGLTAGETYLSYWREAPSVTGPFHSSRWTASSDTYAPIPEYFVHDAAESWFLLRTAPEVETSHDYASISFRRYGGWMQVEPSAPAEDSSFLSDLHIDTAKLSSPLIRFTAEDPDSCSYYAIDLSRDGGQTWSVTSPLSPLTYQPLSPETLLADGETELHYDKVRVIAFGSAGTAPRQHIADCDIAFTRNTALTPEVTYFQGEDGYCYFTVSGLSSQSAVTLLSIVDSNGLQVANGRLTKFNYPGDGTAVLTFMAGNFELDDSGSAVFVGMTDFTQLENTCTSVIQYLEVASDDALSLSIEYFSADIHPAEAGHIYGHPTWAWSEDFQSAEATFACISDDGHTVTVPAVVTLRTLIEPTCTDTGYGVYETSVEFEGQTYTSLSFHSASLPALGHDYAGGVCTRCGHTTRTPGDINGDGRVNNLDVIVLFRYLSNWDVEVVEAALDVNGDGRANNLDVIVLFRYLSGWDVEIH